MGDLGNFLKLFNPGRGLVKVKKSTRRRSGRGFWTRLNFVFLGIGNHSEQLAGAVIEKKTPSGKTLETILGNNYWNGASPHLLIQAHVVHQSEEWTGLPFPGMKTGEDAVALSEGGKE